MITQASVSCALVATALGWTAAPAFGQVSPYVSGFVGYSHIPPFDIALSDPSIATSITIAGREVRDKAIVGGAVGVWTGQRDRRLAWGVRGEVAHQPIAADAQTLSVAGTLFGQSFRGTIPGPAATHVAPGRWAAILHRL
jgi:hypothetical protein